ncbi:MAG: flagellar export protein FliJ [Pseudomonadales bacterium]|nr:flagellar export protein FliJ [Pseudomonadales bacterium]MCP5358182.1 flagellar export protein FliJ [Pseudomonadales bacterium]
MKRSQRLDSVVQLAERRAQDAAQALAFVQQRLQDEQQKLEQLEQYLAEYRDTVAQEGRKGLSVAVFRRYNDFSDNVMKAIAAQTQQVNTVRRQVEQVRRHWQMLDARHKGILKMQDKVRQTESLEAQRQEQKELDDIAGRWRLRHPGL